MNEIVKEFVVKNDQHRSGSPPPFWRPRPRSPDPPRRRQQTTTGERALLPAPCPLLLAPRSPVTPSPAHRGQHQGVGGIWRQPLISHFSRPAEFTMNSN